MTSTAEVSTGSTNVATGSTITDVITVAGVSKAYDRSVVVDDVTVGIPAGGLTAIIGANGAGKSTLLSMVARLLGVDAGTITVAGIDVHASPDAVVARTLAILRQHNSIDIRLTVRELVAFGRFPHSRGRLTVDDRDRIEKALAYLDLTELADRYLDQLSGGQCQRAFLAMVLCQDTEVVLLDEPLAGLDLKHMREIMVRLRRAADELGTTVVLVLHDINVAAKYCDHVIAMRDGRLHAFGPPRAVVTTETLSELFDLEVPVVELDGHPVALYY